VVGVVVVVAVVAEKEIIVVAGLRVVLGAVVEVEVRAIIIK